MTRLPKLTLLALMLGAPVTWGHTMADVLSGNFAADSPPNYDARTGMLTISGLTLTDASGAVTACFDIVMRNISSNPIRLELLSRLDVSN